MTHEKKGGVPDVWRAYKALVNDTRDILLKKMQEIKSRSDGDEPRSEADKELIALIGEITDAVTKSLDLLAEEKNGDR